MSEEQAQWAIQSLYENPGVRGELSDQEADLLLRWGEEQIEEVTGGALEQSASGASSWYHPVEFSFSG